MDIHGFRQQTNNTLQRLIKMSFVPAGFWERFIARMLISLTMMDLQVVKSADCQHSRVALVFFQLFTFVAWNVVFVQSFEPKKNTRSQSRRNSVIYSFAGSQQRNRCSTFRVRRSKTIYWKEGLLVTFDGGYLRSELGLRGPIMKSYKCFSEEIKSVKIGMELQLDLEPLLNWDM